LAEYKKQPTYCVINVFRWLPILAGVAMATSSVTVVRNSILLGRYNQALQLDNQRQERYNRDLRQVYTPNDIDIIR
jgi:hypothetical protein